MVGKFWHHRPASVGRMSTAAASETASDAAPPGPPARKVRTERVLSGVQPTGSLHLGNYLGAIRQWVDFQNNEQVDDDGNIIPIENFFLVVDLHAITMPHNPQDLLESTLSSVALYIAAGTSHVTLGLFHGVTDLIYVGRTNSLHEYAFSNRIDGTLCAKRNETPPP
jgi:hypothetical protein